jgi:hypothetical protein
MAALPFAVLAAPVEEQKPGAGCVAFLPVFFLGSFLRVPEQLLRSGR